MLKFWDIPGVILLNSVRVNITIQLSLSKWPLSTEATPLMWPQINAVTTVKGNSSHALTKGHLSNVATISWQRGWPYYKRTTVVQCNHHSSKILFDISLTYMDKSEMKQPKNIMTIYLSKVTYFHFFLFTVIIRHHCSLLFLTNDRLTTWGSMAFL